MKTYQVVFRILKENRLFEPVNVRAVIALAQELKEQPFNEAAKEARPYFTQLLTKADEITKEQREPLINRSLENVKGFDCVGNEVGAKIKNATEPFDIATAKVNLDAVNDAIAQTMASQPLYDAAVLEQVVNGVIYDGFSKKGVKIHETSSIAPPKKKGKKKK